MQGLIQVCNYFAESKVKAYFCIQIVKKYFRPKLNFHVKITLS